MAADIYTKGYDDAKKGNRHFSYQDVTAEFLRSPQALELSRSTNDLSRRRLPAMSESSVPYFVHTRTPTLLPKRYVAEATAWPRSTWLLTAWPAKKLLRLAGVVSLMPAHCLRCILQSSRWGEGLFVQPPLSRQDLRAWRISLHVPAVTRSGRSVQPPPSPQGRRAARENWKSFSILTITLH